MEKINFYNNNLEVNNAIHKGMEVFLIIKDATLKMVGKTLSMDDKKLLSLLLGIEYTHSIVGKKLGRNVCNYGITVYTISKNRNECIEIYDQHFKNLIDSFSLDTCFNIEELMLALLDIPFVINLHEYNNYSVDKLKNSLTESLNVKKKIKTLQN